MFTHAAPPLDRSDLEVGSINGSEPRSHILGVAGLRVSKQSRRHQWDKPGSERDTAIK